MIELQATRNKTQNDFNSYVKGELLRFLRGLPPRLCLCCLWQCLSMSLGMSLANVIGMLSHGTVPPEVLLQILCIEVLQVVANSQAAHNALFPKLSYNISFIILHRRVVVPVELRALDSSKEHCGAKGHGSNQLWHAESNLGNV